MFKIIVDADHACFTRPECKVERASYLTPTPSALVGMLKSIYWKPAIKYVIDKIVVFNQIKLANVRRNEVKDKVLLSAVKNKMNGGHKDPAILTKESISQRSTLLLKDVKYGIEFHFELTGIRSERGEESNGKHAEVLGRRLDKGQCFRQPCMGCREFPVKSVVRVQDFDLTQVDASLKGETDLGIMLYGLRFHDDPKLKDEWDKKYFSDAVDALFYHPFMVDGVIDVAKYAKEAGI